MSKFRHTSTVLHFFQAEEVEADGDDGGPKRAVHGRKATVFVKKGKAVGAWNLSRKSMTDDLTCA